MIREAEPEELLGKYWGGTDGQRASISESTHGWHPVLAGQSQAFSRTTDPPNPLPPGFHSAVLQEILASFKPIDFRQEAGLDDNKPIAQKVLIVVTIREVLKAAEALGCGLCRDHDFLYSYNGAFWKQIDRQELADFLGEAASRLGVDLITAKYHLFRVNSTNNSSQLPVCQSQNHPTVSVLAICETAHSRSRRQS